MACFTCVNLRILITTIFSTISIIGPVVVLGPQIHRIIRKKTADGIEVKALKMGVAATVGWTVYGITSNLWLVSVASVIGLALLIWTAILCKKLTSEIQLKSITYLSLLYGFVLILLASQSTISMGLVCVLVSSIGPLLQIVRVFKNQHLFGLSAATYVNAIIIHISWIVHGLSHNDAYIIFTNSYGLLVAFVVLLRVVQSRWSKIETTQNLVSSATASIRRKLRTNYR